MKTTLLYLILSIIPLFSYSQKYVYPLKLKPQLSANFGELRNNHFHSGIDLKTDGVANKPVYAVDNGYISRISVSAGGYGWALYINHPSGYTSVYGHLNSFSPRIAQYAKRKQYAKEFFEINVSLNPGELPVKKGEQIALSGNTGGSGGPHLHFEIRDTKTQEPVDALNFFGKIIPDTQKPEIHGIAFYPIPGKGVVNGVERPLRLSIGKNKNGIPLKLNHHINAWGRIGVGVKGNDRMNGQQNIYGVKYVRLYKDNHLVFKSVIDRFSFYKTRMINTFIDFEEWKKEKSFYMKSFVDPGNTLPFYNSINKGFIDINEERDYRMRYELEDQHGNTLSYSFVIKGKKQPVSPADSCADYMSWNMKNSFISDGFQLSIPSGNLYENTCFTHTGTTSATYFSDIHQVNDEPVALDKKAIIWIKLKNDTLQNHQNYGLVRINEDKTIWVGGKYKNGGIEAVIRELGDSYAIDADTISPDIFAQLPEKWISDKRICLRVTDDKSGVGSFRGEIDGKYVLFTHDIKSDYYIYAFDNRLVHGQKHELVFTVSDKAGNSAKYRYAFKY